MKIRSLKINNYNEIFGSELRVSGSAWSSLFICNRQNLD